MISARNYAAHAEAGIVRWASSPFDYKHRDYDTFFCTLIAKSIKDAVHFAIPDNGEIFDDDLKGLDGVKARLPYPLITVEYYVDDTKSQQCDAAPVYSPRRLVLACEATIDGISELQEKMGLVSPSNIFEAFPDNEVTQFIVMNEIDRIWVPCAMSWVMPATWDYSPGGKLFPVEPLVENRSKKLVAGVPVPALPGLYAWMQQEYGEELALRQGMHDISGEVRAVLELCEALTCSNVVTETIQSANAKANAKRAKNGKLPIYETKTLSIEVPKSAQKTGAKRGDRSSPRQHLRRGHIRKLQDDRRVWVNSCAVGSPEIGRIDKSYNVFSS
jgi:hypothetical protein